MKIKTKQMLKKAAAVVMSTALLATVFPGFVSGLTTVKGQDAAITSVSHSYDFKNNAGKAAPVLGQILDKTNAETSGIYYPEESKGSVSFDSNQLKFRNTSVLYLPIQSDTTKITYTQTCNGDSDSRPTYVGQNDNTWYVDMHKKAQSVTIDDITDLIKEVNGQKYIAIYSQGDVKITNITLTEYNPINRVTVSGTLTDAEGVTAIRFKNMDTQEVTTAEVQNGAYSTTLKRVAGNTSYVASISKVGRKIDNTNDANLFALTGNSAETVQNFAVVDAPVAKVSGTVTGVPDSALKAELGVRLIPTDNTLDTVELAVNKTADGSYTYADAYIVPDQEYTVALVNANDYEVLGTIQKAEGTHTDVAITAQAKPVYHVTGTFKTSNGKNAGVSSITFTNMKEAGYSYTFNVSGDAYDVILRDGEYETSVTTAEDGYAAFDHVSVQGADVSNVVYIEGPEDTSAVAYEAEIEVGSGKRFETIQAAVKYIKRMERPNGERVTIKLTDDLYREQIIVDTPNVSIVGTSDKMPTITWYYGIGYSYYSVTPSTELNKGFYSEKYAVDKYTKTAVDTHWGTAVELTPDASGFRSENVIYESSFNRYMTTEEVADGVGPGAEVTKVDRSKATDEDVKKNTNKERACTMYIRADNCEYKNCQFLSSQDTLYTGDGDESIYFRDCVIEGTTDFICGNGNPVFDGCTLSIYGYSDKAADGGYITASKAGGSMGYLFYNCKVVRTTYPGINTATKSVYFGRPWGAGTKMLCFNTEAEAADLIHVNGYATMSGVTPADAFYSEYNTHTPDGAKLDTSKRAKGVKLLTDEEANALSVTSYFSDWEPTYYYADYSAVDEAIAQAQKLQAEDYVDFGKVTQAIEAVVRGLDVSQQASVDLMAKAIQDAIAALELKPQKPSEVTPDVQISKTEGNSETKAEIKNAEQVKAAVGAVEYSAEETAAIQSGAEVKAYLSLDDKEPDTATKVIIADKAGENLKVAKYLDIALFRKVGDMEATKLSQLDTAIRITIEVPSALQENSGKCTFSVIRVHNGAAEILADMDNDPNTVTFETDRFSSYTLVYADQAEVNKPDDSNKLDDSNEPDASDKPEDADQGSQNGSGENDQKTDSTEVKTPQTGDNAFAMALRLMIVSGLILAGLSAAMLFKRNKQA